ncbi:unnamed protein product [Polarella glacialis]|uniref:Uncharacterized protein n=1 Tax=Polarella glacialis TaxID=89957 RepID=A0A813IWQ4_POLGL|nr:unnamed protein product [Polarella glacialis]
MSLLVANIPMFRSVAAGPEAKVSSTNQLGWPRLHSRHSSGIVVQAAIVAQPKLAMAMPLQRSAKTDGSSSRWFAARLGLLTVGLRAAAQSRWKEQRLRARGSGERISMAAGEMSPMTARLVATEELAKIRQKMQATPQSWASMDDRAYAERYRQTLCYLAECYRQALGSLSLSPEGLGEVKVSRFSALLQQLLARCQGGIDNATELLGMPEEEFTSVPKYYYSELHARRKCILPGPEQFLSQRQLQSFLSAEAVGWVRSQERFELLTRTVAAGEGAVPAEHWEKCASGAKEAALDMMTSLLMIFGEKQVATELQSCLKDEQAICDELLDGSKGRVRFSASAPQRNAKAFFALGTGIPSQASEDGGKLEASEDDGDGCRILASSGKPVFIVSDCTGESAERTVRSALGQFGHCFERNCPAEITIFRFATVSMMRDIVQKAQERGAFIVFTLVDPVANAKLSECCEEYSITCHDLWSPLLEKLEGYFDASRLGVPGRRQFADENYMKLIECIEYTRNLDDGVQPSKWAEADILIVGPSRTGKTPLSFFMAQRGYKVANYPLVPDETIPRELWSFPQDRIFALTIEPNKLSGIRDNRMKSLKMSSKSQYAKLSRVREELSWCDKLYRSNPQWTILDATDSGIEENCTKILMCIDRSGIQSRISNSDNPSAI